MTVLKESDNSAEVSSESTLKEIKDNECKLQVLK